jgi:hypothetical protein
MTLQDIPGEWFPKIYRATKDQERLDSIDVLTSLENAAFRDTYESKSVPFIIHEKPPAFSKSEALHILTNVLGEQSVNVRFGDMSKPEAYINRKTSDMGLREFLATFFESRPDVQVAYVGSSPVTDEFVQHLKLEFPRFYSRQSFNVPRLWLGRAGTVTPLHKDIPDNFVFNYFGTKRWILYPPRDYPYLYMTNPTPKEYPDFGASLVNLNDPNYDTYPDFAHAHAVEFTLSDGDLLYLPAGWCHYVENLTDTLMINFWLLRDVGPGVLRKSV